MLSRTHRGLVVTEAGKSIYNDAKYIIGYCDDADSRRKYGILNQLQECCDEDGVKDAEGAGLCVY